MNNFEKFLIDNGYLMFAFDSKEMKYYRPKQYVISTMVNLGHIYIHNTDKNFLDKINKGKSVMDNDFTFEDRERQIVFGLCEKDKPPTLISPRPRINVKRFKIINGEETIVVENERMDDSMNLVLSKINFQDIFNAMYDKSIIFEFDLTQN